MKKLLKFVCISAFSWMAQGAPLLPVTKHELTKSFKKLDLEIPIRVLLDEKKLNSNFSWQFSSAKGFIIFAPEERTKTIFQAKQITITHKGKHFFINGKKQPYDNLFILALDGPLVFNKRSYDGVFAVVEYKDSIYLVNHVDLEEYLLAVLPYESWPAWPDEVQKAFCITFRSYGIAKVLEQRSLHEKKGVPVPYDIKNTTAHQLYKGRSKSDRFKKIVKDTQGVVLAHKNKPILAMFDICCGGITPAHKKGIHFSKAPYLERKYPCNFCKEHKFYKWRVTYLMDQVAKVLKKECPQMGRLREIKVSSYDKAGIAQEVRIRGSNRLFTITAARFKLLFKDIKSLAFTLEYSAKGLAVIGKGHGHHMGLCQRGAYHMVTRGWKYRNILKFYYPHTSFMKLKKIAY
jgi:stage II sporulation protein D